MAQDCCEWSWRSILPVALAALVLIFILAYRRLLYCILITLPRDTRIAIRFLRLKIDMRIAGRKNLTVGNRFDAVVNRLPDKTCFHLGEESWTFKKVQAEANKVGNYFSTQGFKKGDAVALFMENRIEYMCIWLGLSKIGVITAFINYNLRLQPLKHCVETASARAIIYGSELSGAIKDLFDAENMGAMQLYRFGESSPEEDGLNVKVKNLSHEMSSSPTTEPVPSERVNFSDRFCYIYTSGTTGLPKASVIKHSRAMMAVNGVHMMNGVTENDILYTPLPLYHIQGGMVGVGQAIMYGTTVVIAKKFSASRFWKDCIRHDVTVCQYLGELTRYLLNTPPSPEDKMHKVKMMFGNGMRPEIWENFCKRFGNPMIAELYGSTEGNCHMVNINGHIGAVGFFPRVAYPFMPAALIRVDKETGEPLRNKNGFCIICKLNEPGELVARIDPDDPIRDFQGYTDPNSTSKKILYNVYRKGDKAFRTGDILMMDELGYFYFKDRTGDTFRWKGENVSTSEVEGVISKLCDLKDAVVYGVEIPNTDGKAGMAAIADPDGTVDLGLLSIGLIKTLPTYARPLFIRIIKEINMTGTYKLQKVELQKQGFDITIVPEKIYFFQGASYIELDKALYENIMTGKIRV